MSQGNRIAFGTPIGEAISNEPCLKCMGMCERCVGKRSKSLDESATSWQIPTLDMAASFRNDVLPSKGFRQFANTSHRNIHWEGSIEHPGKLID